MGAIFMILRKFRILIIIGLLCGLVLQRAEVGRASSAVLDNTFGTNGIVTFNSIGFAEGMLVQADNKVVLFGEKFDWEELYGRMGTNLRLERKNTNGSADTSFGTNGVTEQSLQWFDAPRDVVFQPADGENKLLMAVFTDVPPYESDLAAIRFNANGSLDTTFGTNGMSLKNAGGSYDSSKAIALLPDGKIMVAGDDSPEDGITGTNLHLMRLNANGTVDITFGGTGVISHNLSQPLRLFEMAAQPDGKTLVIGSLNSQMFLARFNSNGSFDTSFGGTGYIVDSTYLYGTGKQVIVLSDGRLLIIESGYLTGYLKRYNANGTLDQTFGTNGVVTIDYLPITYDHLHSLIVQSDGRIIAGSYLHRFSQEKNTNVYTVYQTRLMQDGSLDSSFGQGGWVTFDAPMETCWLHAGLQSDNKLLVGGGCWGTSYLARLVIGSSGPSNNSPNISQAGPLAVTMDEDSSPRAFSLETLQASDADGDLLSWSIMAGSRPTKGSAQVVGRGPNNTQANVSYTPHVNQNGSDSFTVQVSDGKGGTDTVVVQVTIAAVNDAPTISVPNVNPVVAEGNNLSFNVTINDVDHAASSLVVSYTALPLGATFSNNTFSWTPSEAQGPQSYAVNFTVQDPGGATGQVNLVIQVTEVNQLPQFTGLIDQSAAADYELVFTVSAQDVDIPANTLTFGVKNGTLPEGAQFNATTKEFRWKPTNAQAKINGGKYNVTFTVSDGVAAQPVEKTIVITIQPMVFIPLIIADIQDPLVGEGFLLTFSSE
jgi:uncharacterized delta-60 repeat protein